MERGVDPDTAFLADNGDRWVLEVGCLNNVVIVVILQV